MSRKKIGTVVYHIIVCGMGIIMIYPLLWMIMSLSLIHISEPTRLR